MTVPTPPSNPVTKVELFRRMPVGGTANLTPKCPSEHDPDCDVDCHEAHQVPWKRQHEVGQHDARIDESSVLAAAKVIQDEFDGNTSARGHTGFSEFHGERAANALKEAGLLASTAPPAPQPEATAENLDEVLSDWFDSDWDRATRRPGVIGELLARFRITRKDSGDE